jgi:hypothetical protein
MKLGQSPQIALMMHLRESPHLMRPGHQDSSASVISRFKDKISPDEEIYYLQIAGLIVKLASEKVVAFQNVAYSGLEHVYNPFFNGVCVYSILANIFWCTLHSP